MSQSDLNGISLELYCRMVSIKNTKHQFNALCTTIVLLLYMFICFIILVYLHVWRLLNNNKNNDFQLNFIGWQMQWCKLSLNFICSNVNHQIHLGQILHLVLFYVHRNILSLIYWYFNDIPVLGNTPKYKWKGVYATRKTISDIVELYFLPSTPFFVRSIH